MTSPAAVPSHAVLRSMVLFDLRLTCRSGLHIGAGRGADLAGSDLPVMREASGRPLVPGSSLRGVLRSGIEAVCQTLALDARKPAATGDDELTRDWNEMPLVERIFGRIKVGKEDRDSFASRLRISDLRCADAVTVELRDGVGIERETRTASGGKKFDHEVVPAGTVFEGRVRFQNAADHELGLVAQALWMLDQGLLLLGGKSARGLGWMEVAVSEPWSWNAAELLAGGGRPEPSGDDRFGSVEDRFAQQLEALRQLARREG